MRRALLETTLLLSLAAPPAARAAAKGPQSSEALAVLRSPEGAAASLVPVQDQVINLSLVEALVAVDATSLAGVFGFIPESQAPMAMADYLMHDHRALKKFVKKVARDHKQAKGVNAWDRQVLLYIVGIDAAPALPPGVSRVPKRLMSRIQELSLKQPLPLEVIQSRRAGNG